MKRNEKNQKPHAVYVVEGEGIVAARRAISRVGSRPTSPPPQNELSRTQTPLR
jgi:hypothetical protein